MRSLIPNTDQSVPLKLKVEERYGKKLVLVIE